MNDYPCQPIALWTPEMRKHPCQTVSEFGTPVETVVSQMKTTMHYMDGIGIAAPQILIFQKIAIVELERRPLTMVNPEVLMGDGDTVDWESCLSLPGSTGGNKKERIPNRARVHRLAKINVGYHDIHGKRHEEEFTGYPARIVQHEIDHLSGIFFIDRCGPIFRDVVLRNLRNYEKSFDPSPQPA